MTEPQTPPATPFAPLPANATPQLAADVVIPPNGGASVVHQAFPLKQPKAEADEILVQVRGSVLRRVRQKLEPLTKAVFPWPELLLGAATLLWGAVLGALASDIELRDGRGKLFFVVLPALAVGSSVAYGMLRHFKAVNASSVAQSLLEDIPDPDQTA